MDKFTGNPIKNSENEESNIIQTTDENGETQSFELVDVFTVNDKEYAALINVNDDGTPIENEEEEELIIMRLIEEGDNYTFEEIEDDEEFNAVVDAFENEIDDEEE